MISPKNTKKYKYLSLNPNVSLMFDTREKDPVETRQGRIYYDMKSLCVYSCILYYTHTQALTVRGHFSPITDTETDKKIKSKFLQAFPYMKSMLDEDVIVLNIQCLSYQLLSGLSDIYFIEVEK